MPKLDELIDRAAKAEAGARIHKAAGAVILTTARRRPTARKGK